MCPAVAGDLREFFDTCGYVLVRNVFSADEVRAFLEDADVLREEAREGDKVSWWGRDKAATTVLCRVLRAASRPRLRTLHDDPRVLALAALSPQPVTAAAQRRFRRRDRALEAARREGGPGRPAVAP